MKTKGKAWQLVLTVLLIAAFVYTAFFGVAVKYGDVTTTYIKGAKDIRFGVDIKGGVNVTFVPSDGYDATDDQLEAAQLVIENRLVALNVTDYELYVDNNSDSLILEFPWQSGETEFDPEAAIEEIGTTAYLTFREGSSADGELVLDGSMVESAAAQYGPVNGSSSEYYVALKFTDEGAKAFGDATTRLYQTGGTISIWLDDENVCADGGQLLHHQPESGREQPERHGAGRSHRLRPHRGSDDGSVPSARLPGLHRSGWSGGGYAGLRLRLLPGV